MSTHRTVQIMMTFCLLSCFSMTLRAEDDLGAGKKIYEARCVYCHGAEGRGDGVAAPFLVPKPRDFTRGQFKVRSTVSGALPTDDDLLRVVGQGMPGSAMPAWSKILSETEMRQVIAYIKTFSKRFARQKAPPEKIRFGPPIEPSPESIARGRQLFDDLECWKCHGKRGRGDGPSAASLKDEWDNAIRATDLSRPWNFRGGGRNEDIYRTFLSGFAGTPMPSYADVFETPEQADTMNWHLVNYVATLAPHKEKPEIKPVMRSERIAGAVPVDPADPLWARAEAFSFPLVGQIVEKPRWFTPAIDLVTVKSLRNDAEIGFLVEWHDPTASRPDTAAAPGSARSAPAYADAVALQFPVTYAEGAAKPYFLMGDSRNPVNLWTWSAFGDGTAVESNARGMDKITRQPDALPGGQGLQSHADYQSGRYRVAIRRKLVTEAPRWDVQFEAGRFIPIAFHAWDGSNGETGKKHAVSAWYLLYLEPPAPLRLYAVPPILLVLAIGVEIWCVRTIGKGKDA